MLEVDGVNARYGQFHALKDVTIQVGDGELVAVFGPNGHGKSTLLKTVSGLLKTDSGVIRWNGSEIQASGMRDRVEMGIVYVPEDRHLFPEMTVLENLRLGAYPRRARARERESLDLVFSLFPKLRDLRSRDASTLSGGEARMVAIGRGLMSNAQLLAIDEPSFGLAPNLRKDVFNQIGEIRKRGTSVLLVEQSTSDIARMADRVCLMEDGRVVFEGDVDALLADGELQRVFLGIG